MNRRAWPIASVTKHAPVGIFSGVMAWSPVCTESQHGVHGSVHTTLFWGGHI